MKRYDRIVVLVLLALGIATLNGCRHSTAVGTGGFDIPPSLVARMYDAHNAARDARLGADKPFDSDELFGLMAYGYTNAEEIAYRPRGEMVFCADRLTEEMREKLWPFEVEAFEAALEEKMMRDKDGLFRKKPDVGEDIPIGDDGLVASNPTIRWVNGEMEKWAIAQLDAKYSRLDDKSFSKASGYQRIPDGWFVWLLADLGGVRECFVIERSDGAWNPRYYMELLCDDNGVTIIASFDSFPNRREAAAMRMFGGDIAAVHNIAVLEWMHRSSRTGMNPRRIKRYLEEAKRLEVPTAEANLKILLDHVPQGAIEEAPYTIEIL